jgi:hypothetical protein
VQLSNSGIWTTPIITTPISQSVGQIQLECTQKKYQELNESFLAMGWCCSANESDDWNTDSDCVTISTDNRIICSNNNIISSSWTCGGIEIIDSETT